MVASLGGVVQLHHGLDVLDHDDRVVHDDAMATTRPKSTGR